MADKEKYFYNNEVYTITEAKKVIKELIKNGFHDAKAIKYKVYSSGEWINCGEIKIKGKNTSYITNCKMARENYV
ncbi:MAG: hypothetical protein HUJ68_01020 [Clostridia bacterium]|nr:hypothetical protein [Clostridia bacterium]